MASELLSPLQTIVRRKVLLISNTNATLSMSQDIINGSFVWDEEKETHNKRFHGLDFTLASKAFFDPKCIIVVDETHSELEERFFCIGKVEDRCVTVRFTLRENKIRIIGAGYWRKGRKFYEAKYKI